MKAKKKLDIEPDVRYPKIKSDFRGRDDLFRLYENHERNRKMLKELNY